MVENTSYTKFLVNQTPLGWGISAWHTKEEINVSIEINSHDFFEWLLKNYFGGEKLEALIYFTSTSEFDIKQDLIFYFKDIMKM